MAHPGPHGLATGRRLPVLMAVLAATVLASALVSGCGQDQKAPGKAPAQVMQIAKQHFDDASSVHIALSTTSTPSAGDGVLAAIGDLTHDPAFQGDVNVLLNHLNLGVPVTSIGGKVYAKLTFQTKYSLIDPADYGAPDPADFANPETGLSGLLTKLEGLEKGSQKRSGDTILTSYTGTLPGAVVKKIIPSAEAKKTYKTSVGIDGKGYARTVKVTGAFFSGNGDVTYDVKFSGYDKGVKITAPTAG